MKDKKTFGNFIRQKRIENNYSQKELADILFVTESAVSKWERGVTYPDITLIKSICKALNITEHELIESSHDSEYRQIAKDAKKYNNIKKTLFWTINIMYAMALLVCFIVNLAVGKTLSWFFIVLASIMVAYTFCPTLTWVFKKHKKLMFIGSSILSLFLLFLTCSIYTNNYWFMIAIISVILGYFIIFYPILFVSQKNYLSKEKYDVLSKYFLLTYTLGMLILIILLLICIHIKSPFNLGVGIIIAIGCLLIPIVFGLLNISDFTKVIKKVVIAVLCAGVICFAGFSIFATIKMWNSMETKTVLIDGEYENISIDVTSYDVNIYMSSTDEDKIVYSANDRMYINTYVSNNTLIIQDNNDIKFYEMMVGFDYNIDLFLTKSSFDKLNVDATSGDVDISNGFTFNDLNIELTTGDIDFMGNVNNDINFVVTSGDVTLNKSNVNGNLYIKTTSGEIIIDNVKANKLEMKNTTGDVKLSNTIITTDFIFNGTTADVIFDGFDAKSIYVKVNTGSIKGTLLSEKMFFTKTTSGNVVVPESTSGGSCKLITTSGNINISYK